MGKAVNKKVLAIAFAVLALNLVSYGGLKSAYAIDTLDVDTSNAQIVKPSEADEALARGRDQAVATVQNVAGKANAGQYVDYLNDLIAKADCYLAQASATCNYSEKDVLELTQALEEGAKATVYLTSEGRKNGGTKVATVGEVAPTVKTTTMARTVANINTTSKVSDNKSDDLEQESTSDEEVTEVELPKAGIVEDDSRRDSVQLAEQGSASVRIWLATVAGLVIFITGVTIIGKWSKGNV